MIIVDVIIVSIFLFYVVRKQQFNLLNPFLIYLLIHTIFVTLRTLQISFLDADFLSNRIYRHFLNQDEYDKAILIADIGLISFAIGFFSYKYKSKKLGNNVAFNVNLIQNARQKLINVYLALIFTLGLIGIIFTSYIPGVGLGAARGSLAMNFFANFSLVSVILLIYENGFKRKYLVVLIIYLLIFALQGYARYRVVLPLLFLLMYYLKIRGLRFPPPRFFIFGVLILILSLPLKEVGKDLKAGLTVSMSKTFKNAVNELLKGEAGDLALIEQSAALIGNIDYLDKTFYGETYSSIFFFFIPRSIWKDKPRLNEWQFEVSDSSREFGKMGQISLITGEAYANFRYLGVVFVLLFLGRFYSFLYHRYVNTNVLDRGFLMLLLFNMVLFQVWRDGLISLFLFPLLNYFPIVGLYLIKPNSNKAPALG